MNDTRVATVKVRLEGADDIVIPQTRTLGTISIRHGAALTRFLHEACRYADADQIRPEDFGSLTFAELHGVDLGPWSCSGLDISVRWILDDLLELLMD